MLFWISSMYRTSEMIKISQQSAMDQQILWFHLLLLVGVPLWVLSKSDGTRTFDRPALCLPPFPRWCCPRTVDTLHYRSFVPQVAKCVHSLDSQASPVPFSHLRI